MVELSILFVAGVLGGVINTVAGGGSFITFPTLMFVGVPPIVANATNTFSVCAGYLSGAYGFRHDLAECKAPIVSTVLWSLLGGAIGAYLLLNTPEHLFIESIPWLLMFATALFMFGDKLASRLTTLRESSPKATALTSAFFVLLLVSVSAYGGFFNAGLGIIVLSYLVVSGYSDINQMNGLKLLVSSSVSLIAITIFALDGAIDWWRGAVVMLGTLVGGYVAARVSRSMPQHFIRHFVSLSSVAMTGYFFWDVYA